MNEEIKKAKAKLAAIMDAINREQGISEELTARRSKLELDVKNLDVVIARKKEELEKVILDLNNKQLDMKGLIDEISAINGNKVELENEFESRKREVEYLKEEKEKAEKEMLERKENVENKIKVYKYAIENSKHKLCYNGDIFTVKDYNNFIKEFPNTDTIMVGRGIISNPALACEIKNIKKLNKDDLYKFYEKMFNDYKEILSGDTPLLHKMKEVFVYMIDSFNDCDKIAKKIKKAKNVRDFKNAVNELFSCCEVI